MLALLSFAPAFWFAYSALSDGLAVAFDSIWGFLFCCGMILLAVLLLAVSAFWSYLLYIWIVCIAELLRCIASIEHNTRTARTHSEVEGGFREQPVPHAVAEPLKSAGGA